MIWDQRVIVSWHPCIWQVQKPNWISPIQQPTKVLWNGRFLTVNQYALLPLSCVLDWGQTKLQRGKAQSYNMSRQRATDISYNCMSGWPVSKSEGMHLNVYMWHLRTGEMPQKTVRPSNSNISIFLTSGLATARAAFSHLTLSKASVPGWCWNHRSHQEATVIQCTRWHCLNYLQKADYKRRDEVPWGLGT